MAKSPLNDRTDIVSFSVEVNGRPIDDKYQILSCEVEKEAYKISRATLTFLIPFDASEAKAFEISERGELTPGNAINIKLGYRNRNKSVFKGIIVHQGIEIPIGRVPVLTVQCSDKAVSLTLGRNSKCFQEKKDSDILEEVIDNRGLTASVDPTDLRHKQLIQYQAIDWDFIITRAQANGLLVYYEQDKLYVKKPVINDSCGLELTHGEDINSFKGGLESRFQMPAVTAGTWQFDEQAFQEKKSREPSIPSHGNLNGKKLSAVLGLSAYDVQSTASLENEEMQSWANATLLKARLAAMRGEVSFIGSNLPQINKTIQLKGLGKRFNGDALITKVRHSLFEGQWETTIGFGLDPEWYHESRNVNSPLASGLLPAIHGLQNGIVTKIHEDPEGEHRIQVNVPVMGANGEGIWARQAVDYATEGKGLFFRPEMGDEVVLGFLNDDPRFPVILGSLYSSQKPPPYTADEQNSIKAIVTKSNLKIELDDEDKMLTIATPSGNSVVLSDKAQELILKDGNGNKITMSNKGISLESSKDVVIKAAGKIDLQANSNIDMEAKGDIDLEGLNVEAKAQIAFKAQGSASAEISASGNTTIKGSLVKIN